MATLWRESAMDGSFFVSEFWCNVLLCFAFVQLAGALLFAGFVAYCLWQDDCKE